MRWVLSCSVGGYGTGNFLSPRCVHHHGGRSAMIDLMNGLSRFSRTDLSGKRARKVDRSTPIETPDRKPWGLGSGAAADILGRLKAQGVAAEAAAAPTGMLPTRRCLLRHIGVGWFSPEAARWIGSSRTL
jgi:hypothetical protein